jgi:hypothetical protein
MLDNQQATNRKLDAAIERMATKDDINHLMEDRVTRSEYLSMKEKVDNHDRSIEEFKSNRLPRWFWPLIAGVVTVVTPLLSLLVTRLLG